ncbi:MAG TPA: zf-HC2 domain-containing protein [Spirochaetota bacterium]|nr:zf-HC2 domain-containing protein [Spirochaetota bacterium]HPJ34009.1 zf-HC2 domain-containing protein [Spirochaetota bacterium]
MKCRDAKELLNSYFDNGLDPAKDPVLMEHIRNCPECRKELLFLAEYGKTIKEIKPVKAPQNFMAELHEKLEAKKRGRFNRDFSNALEAWRNFTFPREAAGIIAVAVLIFFLYSPMFRGGKEMKTYREDQPVITSPPELIIKEKKLRPLLEEKASEDERESVPSVKESIKTETRAKKSAGRKRASENLIMDNISRSSGDSGEDLSLDDEASASIKEEADDLNKSDLQVKSESEKHSGMKSDSLKSSEGKFKYRRALKDREESYSPGGLISEYSLEVLDKKEEGDSILFTIKIEEDRLEPLKDRLKDRYIIKSAITGKSGATLTVELILTEKNN